MSDTLREKILLFRIRFRKDPDAFGQIYDRYVHRIYRFVYFKVPSADDAQDITSEVFLKFWNYLQEGNSVTHVAAFLYRVARNLVTDFYRSNARSEEHISYSDNPEIARLLADTGGLTEIEQSLDIGRVLQALGLLKDEYREAIVLRYVDELTNAEIAEILGKKQGNVRVLIHRSLETLRALLQNTPRSK